MANIYDTANQLEREIRQSEQFQELSASFDRLKANEEAYSIFKEFQALQQELQTKMMAGEEVSEEDAQKAQAMAEKVQKEDLINQLMQTEQAFSTVVNDLNRIIMGPVRELYEG
ncbi:YlbF family regulator [Enterococcus mediterraneensis]|uniref:YlbF family regulator n=1 Tax=Enterococcus mediterraneensis TaxID=2364791 RepID=UPI000F06B56E|nr:YlbF family regulator [Enterococcus mediterraneensis]